MNILEGKLALRDVKLPVIREDIGQIISKKSREENILFFMGNGCEGAAEAVCCFLRYEHCENFGYLKLDQYDNEEEVLARYVKAMFIRTGIRINESEAGLHAIFQEALIFMSKSEKEYLFIFDQVQSLNTVQILSEFVLFLTYAEKKCRIFMLSNGCLAEEWLHLAFSPKAGIFPMRLLKVSMEELCSGYRKGGIPLQMAQADEIQRRTGGWPGTADCLRKYLKSKAAIPEGIWNRNDDPLDFYIERNLWEACSPIEKDILECGCIFSCLTEKFCTEVLEINPGKWLFWKMEMAGLLISSGEEGKYLVPEMIQEYWKRRHSQRHAETALCRKAMKWHDSQGEIREVLNIACRIQDREAIERCMMGHVDKLLHLLTENELRLCVQIVGEESQNAAVLYVKAVLAVWEGEEDRKQRIQQELYRQYEMIGTRSGKKKIGEILINVLYEDTSVSITEWIRQAQSLTAEIGPVPLYHIFGGELSIRCGAKDMTEMFAGGLKEERSFRKGWDQIVIEEQRILWDVAEADYCLETNREKQAIQKIQALLPYIEKSRDISGKIGLVAILHHAFSEEQQYDHFYRDLADDLRERKYIHVLKNMDAFYVYASARRSGSKEAMAEWIRKKDAGHVSKITQENAFWQLIRAKSLLLLRQYPMAKELFGRLAEYYQRKKIIQHQAECLFAQAVIAYEEKDRSGALRMAIQALTAGAPCRYVGIYTEYGETGAALIESYQKVIADPAYARKQSKKKYYYGNVLRATHEGYQNMLLRCARKKSKSTAAALDKKQELLTITETAILQYINNGYTNQEIAGLMNIKLTTVKSHIYNIYRKLGVSGRVQAIIRGKEERIL